jgi:hypothetical protein
MISSTTRWGDYGGEYFHKSGLTRAGEAEDFTFADLDSRIEISSCGELRKTQKDERTKRSRVCRSPGLQLKPRRCFLPRPSP